MTKRPPHARTRDQSSTAMTPSPDAPQWVAEMHQYFAEHGHYRASDLMRVTGDPTASVGSTMVEDPITNLAAEILGHH